MTGNNDAVLVDKNVAGTRDKVVSLSASLPQGRMPDGPRGGGSVTRKIAPGFPGGARPADAPGHRGRT